MLNTQEIIEAWEAFDGDDESLDVSAFYEEWDDELQDDREEYAIRAVTDSGNLNWIVAKLSPDQAMDLATAIDDEHWVVADRYTKLIDDLTAIVDKTINANWIWQTEPTIEIFHQIEQLLNGVHI